MRTRSPVPVAVLAVLAVAAGPAGCWKDELAQITVETLRFRPEIGAPEGWLVAPVDLGLSCPDGGEAPLYLLYPADPPADPLPIALLFPSGAFDYVYAPIPGDPLSGAHFATPSRLGADWAIDRVFATLGMVPEPGVTPGVDVHDGSLPVALAEAGVPALVPTNCWGDLWANDRAIAGNDFGADLFFREGRTAALWAYRVATDPAFAEQLDVELPIAVDPAAVFAIGLGEGGRAVAALLGADDDGDGIADVSLAGALVDSPPDDLRLYFEDEGVYAPIVEGLDRLFPEGPESAEASSLWAVPLPGRFGLLWSSADPALPPGILDAALAAASGGGRWVFDAAEPVHVLSNGGASDPTLARDAVAYLITGEAPIARRVR